MDYWFDVVFENDSNLTNKALLINGCVEAIALGHGNNDGITEHPYFGTENVI